MEKLKRNIPLYKDGLWSINHDPKTWFKNNTHFSMRFNLYPLWKTLDPESRKNFWKKFSREAVQERANKQRREFEEYRQTLIIKAKKARNKTRKKKLHDKIQEHKALVDFNKIMDPKSNIGTGKWSQGRDEIYRQLLRQRTPNYDVVIPQIPGPPTHPPPTIIPPVLPGPPPIPSGASKRVDPYLERTRLLFPEYQAARERNRQLEMLDRVRWNPDSNDFVLTSEQKQEASAAAQKANSDISVKEKIERACSNAGNEAKKCGMRFMSLMEQLNAGFGGKTRKKKRRRRTKKTKRKRTKKRVGKSSKRKKTRKRK